MPAIAEKRTVLNGRGIVGVWANGTSAGKFFYREKVEGRKAYRFKELLEASNLDEAERLATEAAIELRETKPPASPKNYDPLDLIAREEKLVKQKERLIREEKKKESPKEKLEKVIDDWLSTIKKKADTGTIEQSTYEFKWSCMRHVRLYIKHKKITLTSQIN